MKKKLLYPQNTTINKDVFIFEMVWFYFISRLFKSRYREYYLIRSWEYSYYSLL